ncbi:MAG: putative 4-hydroxybenzoate polyprenyltransferase, partial [Ignavibacteria bacterium]|nr:putative 4-hydroxybenzoate polyprenyltransferase [Ignavibacteria bacterium]
IRIEHTIFSLPLIYSGVFLASGSEFPSLRLLILVFIAATFARTAAMTANRIIDSEIDKKNPRTLNREIPAGKISIRKAIFIFIISLIGYSVTAYFISMFCFILSPIPIIIFITYPYMKRFTHLAHFGVGLGLASASLGGWLAVKNSWDDLLPGALITLFTLFWATGFDIIYSTLDEEFDRANGLKSFPVKFGKNKALLFSALFHFISFLFLTALHFTHLTNWFSFIFLIAVAVLLFFEHKFSENVELAFFKINSIVGFAVFLMVIVKGIFY